MFEVQAAKIAATVRPPLVHMAKWPPDDSSMGGPVGGYPPGGGGFDPGDGNFKKGKVKPIVALNLVAVVAAGGALFLGVNTELDKEELTPEKVAQLTTQTLMLPKSEQLPKWEGWAKDPEGNALLKEESLK